MNDRELELRNSGKIAECYWWFQFKLRAVLSDVEGHGFRPRIQEAWRSPKDELEAYRTGHSHVKFGLHNCTGRHGAKESLAADVLEDDSPLAPTNRYLLILAGAAEAHHLHTGIRWGLPGYWRNIIDLAIKTKNWDRDIRIGFDPCHVEVPVLPLLARLGWRPNG